MVGGRRRDGPARPLGAPRSLFSAGGSSALACPVQVLARGSQRRQAPQAPAELHAPQRKSLIQHNWQEVIRRKSWLFQQSKH